MYFTIILIFLARLDIVQSYCDSAADYSEEYVDIYENNKPLLEVLKDINTSTRNLRIQYMDIPSLNLQEFSRFSNLRTLIVEYCNVREVKGGNLPSLKKLDLSDNDINTLNDTTFRGLTRLESLDLKTNNIRTISKGTFHRLKHLTNINLRSNPVSNVDRMFIHNKNLVTLNLMDVHLRSFPIHLPESLQNLCLGYNNISSIRKNKG